MTPRPAAAGTAILSRRGVLTGALALSSAAVLGGCGSSDPVAGGDATAVPDGPWRFTDDTGRVVELDLDPRLPAVVGDPHELEQAVVNLVSNAQQAIAATRRPGIVTLRTSMGPAGAPILDVEDDGPGIPEEHRARVFDPFFTTKAAGQGTGNPRASGANTRIRE